MSKGFFSAAINALVIGAVVTAALFALTYAASYDASVKGLEAKRVAERAYDGNHGSRQVVLDSLMDSSFAVYGCSPLPLADFCTVANDTYASYLAGYSSALNDSVVNFNSTPLGIYCNSTDSTAGFNWSFAYAANTSFTANSSNAKKTLLDSFSWTLEILNYTPAVVNDTQTCSDEVLMRIAVNDSSGYLLDYDVNCSQAPINLGAVNCP